MGVIHVRFLVYPRILVVIPEIVVVRKVACAGPRRVRVRYEFPIAGLDVPVRSEERFGVCPTVTSCRGVIGSRTVVPPVGPCIRLCQLDGRKVERPYGRFAASVTGGV